MADYQEQRNMVKVYYAQLESAHRKMSMVAARWTRNDERTVLLRAVQCWQWNQLTSTLKAERQLPFPIVVDPLYRNDHDASLLHDRQYYCRLEQAEQEAQAKAIKANCE